MSKYLKFALILFLVTLTAALPKDYNDRVKRSPNPHHHSKHGKIGYQVVAVPVYYSGGGGHKNYHHGHSGGYGQSYGHGGGYGQGYGHGGGYGPSYGHANSGAQAYSNSWSSGGYGGSYAGSSAGAYSYGQG